MKKGNKAVCKHVKISIGVKRSHIQEDWVGQKAYVLVIAFLSFNFASILESCIAFLFLCHKAIVKINYWIFLNGLAMITLTVIYDNWTPINFFSVPENLKGQYQPGFGIEFKSSGKNKTKPKQNPKSKTKQNWIK